MCGRNFPVVKEFFFGGGGIRPLGNTAGAAQINHEHMLPYERRSEDQNAAALS